MSLVQFQKKFLSSISNQTENWFKEHITPGGTLTQEAAINVYRGDYYARLSEAIGERYESVWFVLGDEDFLQLAREFIESNPSGVRDLGSYAEEFPQYLKACSHHDEFPFLSDLAFFEQNFWRLFHSPPANSYDPFGAIAAEDLGNTRWLLPEGSFLQSWDYDIPLIFAAREGKAEDEELDYEHAAAVLMIKLEQNVRIIRLTPNQYAILGNLNEGATLEEALVGEPTEIQNLFTLLKGQGIPLRRRFEGAS